LEFYYLINLLIFARLFFFFRDRPITLKKTIFISFLQIFFLLLFELSFSLSLFILSLAFINLLLWHVENKYDRRNLNRFLSLIVLVLLSSFFTSQKLSLELSNGVASILKDLAEFFFVPVSLESFDLLAANIILMGFLLLLNEVNFLIRIFFETFKLVPLLSKEGEDNIDIKEYNAGRVIGMLERVLIFLFVLLGEFTAIGFILAAKGFTRFKELDKREFAEYVLSGTLFSSLAAIIVALIVKRLLVF
jgi:hypothetical protein